MKKERRSVLDKDYYILQAMYRSSKFRRLVKAFLDKFAELGVPIPKERFKTVAEYHKWAKELKKLNHYPTLGEILSAFSLDPKNDTYLAALAFKIYFNREPKHHKSLTAIKWDDTKDPPELWIKVPSYLRTKHISDIWPYIQFYQRKLPSDRIRYKPWISFERDFTLYELYLRVRQNISKGKLKKEVQTKHGHASKSVLRQMEAYPEFREIAEEEGVITNDMIIEAVKECKRRLGPLELLEL